MNGRALVVCLLFLASGVAASAQTAPQRDALGLSILSNSVNASGGPQALDAIQDYSAPGNVTFHWGNRQVQGTVTVKGRGLTQFRMDSQTTDGSQSWVVNGFSGELVTTDGTSHRLAPYNLIDAGSLTLPTLRIAAALAEPSVGVTYLGEQSVDGRQVYEVKLTPAAEPGRAPVTGAGGAGTLTLLIDSSTFRSGPGEPGAPWREEHTPNLCRCDYLQQLPGPGRNSGPAHHLGEFWRPGDVDHLLGISRVQHRPYGFRLHCQLSIAPGENPNAK